MGFVSVFVGKVHAFPPLVCASYLDSCIFTRMFLSCLEGLNLLASVWAHPHDSPAEKYKADCSVFLKQFLR